MTRKLVNHSTHQTSQGPRISDWLRNWGRRICTVGDLPHMVLWMKSLFLNIIDTCHLWYKDKKTNKFKEEDYESIQSVHSAAQKT